MTDACRLSRWAETYLDGELSPENTVDFEDHLSGCCSCQSRMKFEQALRFSMRRTVRVATYPSPDFESRMRAMMAAARDTDDAPSSASRQPKKPAAVAAQLHAMPLTWRAIAPLSVAAAAALMFAALRNEPMDVVPGETIDASTTGTSAASKDTMQTVREFLDQLAVDSEHHPELASAVEVDGEPVFVASRPPSIINLNDKRRWPLPKLDNLGGIWEGLHYRNLALHGRVPSLHYRIGGHRVLLWAYDSERVPLRAVLQAQVARSQPVFVGTRHGLAIAAVENGNHGLAITTDLSTSEAAELAVAAVVH
jgi:hypothetical protein